MYLALVDHMADFVERSKGDMVTVTIDGFSGAGKTSLGERLVREFQSRTPAIHSLLLEVELWSKGWGDLHGAVERVREVAQGLQSGPVQTQTWNWWSETVEDPLVLTPKPLLLIVGSGSGQIPSDISVWIDADRELRQRRVASRDPYDWSQHWDEWEAQELELLERHDSRKHADFRLTSNS